MIGIKTARAIAHSNIALIKYWGKREGTPGVPDDLNLPAVGSLSLTLDSLRSETEVGPSPSERDAFVLNGEHRGDTMAAKVFRHLDRIWAETGNSGPRPPCQVISHNHLPTSAGLASSASGFAALTLAGAAALELDASPAALSALARRGSGSAARSLWGGFVRLERGHLADGSDCQARPLFPASHWDVRLLIVHTARGPKAIGSTEGMERCRRTSPYYSSWVDTSEGDLAAAEAAIAARDLAALGPVMEQSCFKMHACMMATYPPIIYWNGVTLEVMRAVWEAREAGLEGYATSDAGPHVKVLCLAATAEALAERLAAQPGVLAVESVGPGPNAQVEVFG
ncbi:MAG: diphosphomevalonate decarboxylase [Myxococcales bacterium]|nr:diphosphomevalonate decarboxylase [Myxococcales bacterium]MCB9705722.1 diphosphomevalonate decarboxylase [Myxococcales bacterium]